MKNRIFTIGLLLLGISWGTAQTKLSKAEKTEFIVSGNCEMCKKRIEQATLAVKGVKMVTWDIPSNVLSVIYNAKKQDLNAIHEAIAAAGHDTDRAKAPEDVYTSLPLCCLYEREQ
ncbi:MAG: heavy-metal-associated domain-containing protein [Flavobacteriales bacterium]|jgi:mercuric ion binding protein|nr:heavy-metal-associated domain-containing protein [Flavobacteriales bacterium]MBT7656726.1 heavy-metal-associated domain-containing protein [Flavobacteriales bacterium]MDG1271654.1 heavy-metal-associated domain-containing protein [Flavobacteriaceae bacterium]